MISIYDKRFWFQAKTWKQETFSFLKNSLRNTFESVFHCCDRKTCKKFDMFTSHANFFFEGNFFVFFWEQVVYPCLHTSDINPFFVQLYQQSGVYRDNKSQWEKKTIANSIWKHKKHNIYNSIRIKCDNAWVTGRRTINCAASSIFYENKLLI